MIQISLLCLSDEYQSSGYLSLWVTWCVQSIVDTSDLQFLSDDRGEGWKVVGGGGAVCLGWGER